MSADRLSDSRSPYLRMHASDPVDWYPWGAEAFADARERDVPIFLSSGYSACHWCHVMQAESFKDPETARILNESFVAVKVDREQRPDVDALYMDYVVATSGQGGWPMSVFLTPGRVPIFGGTYFPKDEVKGLPAFREVLSTVRDTWAGEREHAETLGEAALGFLRGQAGPNVLGLPDAVKIDEGAEAMMRDVDPVHGGFGARPKFPQVPVILYLLAYAGRVGDDEVLYQAGAAVRGMIRGGIFDQAGGGIARYSTDEQWLVPHFEKMLYDQALLLSALGRLHTLEPSDEYAHAAKRTAAFLQRELAAPGGAYHAALSADTGGIEGGTYVWRYEELAEALTADELAIAERRLGVRPEGVWEGLNILSRPDGHDEEPEAVDGVLARILEARSRRPQPEVDTKVLTSWNALAARGLIEAGNAIDDREMTGLGVAVLSVLLGAVDGDDVRHELGAEDSVSLLEDYAALVAACLTGYETLGDEDLLAEARRLHDVTLARFESDGLLYMTETGTDLPVRPREQNDLPVPSGASTALENAMRLYEATKDAAYLEWTGKALRPYHVPTEYTPDHTATALLAMMRYLDATLEATETGS